jgi:hypothetical protein
MKKNAVFTVAEASEKWCPFAGVSRFSRQHEMCAGPGCMAWRWHTTHVNEPRGLGGTLIESGDTYGYCGLAGAP